MAGEVSWVLERLRQPEYTGENRCWPCTIANLAIATGGAIVIAAGAAWTGASVGIAATAGAGVFAVSAAAIYLRGYLVPGTPTLTKRYFPDWLLKLFDKHPAGRSEPTESDVDRETLLKDAGVVEDCEEVDDLCLSEDFRTAWRDRVRSVRDRGAEATTAELATVLGADPGALTVRPFEEAYVAQLDGRRVGQWESEAAFLADMGAMTELRERVDGWDRLPVDERGELLNRLRVFLEECPACDGPVAVGEDVIESCCRSIDVVAVSCQECGARLFEAEQPA